jgi:LmbE family N-acetylglucosaminyl deacetylase
MLPFHFDDASLQGRPTLLAVGAHSDDIEIGCGGMLLHLAETYPNLEVVWVVLSATAERAMEARASAEAFLGSVASLRVIVEDFRDKYFAHDGDAMRELFEWLETQINPDIILTHRRADSHQDHRFVCELTWNTFRNNLILEYEIPKYDGDLSSPNLFVPISQELAERKVETILRCFETQRQRHWFTEDLFMAMMRLRGMEANSPTRLAEAFTCRKLVLDMTGAKSEPQREATGVVRSLHSVSGEQRERSMIRLSGARLTASPDDDLAS